MTDKELKKMSRRELLEMLLIQTREVERLEKELEAANQKLEDRRIELEDTGDIAQATLRLTGLFETAQAAADLYVANIRRMESETHRRCDEMIRQARQESCHFWEDIRDKVRDPFQDHQWWTETMKELSDHVQQLRYEESHEE